MQTVQHALDFLILFREISIDQVGFFRIGCAIHEIFWLVIAHFYVDFSAGFFELSPNEVFLTPTKPCSKTLFNFEA
jgi:hypothetical protein